MRQVMKLQCRRGQSFWTYGDTWQTNSDARKKDGVGEYCDTEKIDKDRGVTEPGECHLRVTPFRRLGFRRGWRDSPPAFNGPFAKQTAKPATHPGSARNGLLRCIHPRT